MTKEENRKRLDTKLLLTVKRLTEEKGLTLSRQDVIDICIRNNYPKEAEERVTRLFPHLT